MGAKAGTDRSSPLESNEFVWCDAEHTAAHDYLAEPVMRLLEAAGARRVLDMGCGNGAFSTLLDNRGFIVSGCDASQSGLSLARNSAPALEFFYQDLQEPLPLAHQEAYDAVVSIEVIEHLLLPRRLLLNARAALRTGGLLVITTPFHGYWKNVALALANKFDRHWQPLQDFGHVKFFSKRTIMALFREFQFRQLRFQTAGRFPPLACSMIVSGTKE